MLNSVANYIASFFRPTLDIKVKRGLPYPEACPFTDSELTLIALHMIEAERGTGINRSWQR